MDRCVYKDSVSRYCFGKYSKRSKRTRLGAILLVLNSKPDSYNCFGQRKDVLRDFKKYTSKKLLSVIEANEKESRRIWMLELFAKAGEANGRNKRYQFWRQGNQPKQLITGNFTN